MSANIRSDESIEQLIAKMTNDEVKTAGNSNLNTKLIWETIGADERIIGLTVNPGLTYLGLRMITNDRREKAYLAQLAIDKDEYPALIEANKAAYHKE